MAANTDFCIRFPTLRGIKPADKNAKLWWVNNNLGKTTTGDQTDPRKKLPGLFAQQDCFSDTVVEDILQRTAPLDPDFPITPSDTASVNMRGEPVLGVERHRLFRNTIPMSGYQYVRDPRQSNGGPVHSKSRQQMYTVRPTSVPTFDEPWNRPKPEHILKSQSEGAIGENMERFGYGLSTSLEKPPRMFTRYDIVPTGLYRERLPVNKDFTHTYGFFINSNPAFRSCFIIHPEWVSESSGVPRKPTRTTKSTCFQNGPMRKA